MPQLAGLNCSICAGRIVSVESGRICPDCRQPVHTACAGPVAAEGTCPACGAAADGLLPETPSAARQDAAGAGAVFEWLSFRGRASRRQYFTHSLVSGVAIVGMAGVIRPAGPALGPLVLLLVIVVGMWS